MIVLIVVWMGAENKRCLFIQAVDFKDCIKGSVGKAGGV
jgi:hypothetical protein